MRILLLNPPSRDGRRYVREGRCTHAVSVWGTAWPPYTLAMLGRRLKDQGHIVRLLDAAVGDIQFNQLHQAVESYEPHVTLLSVSAPTLPSDLQVIGEIRQAAPTSWVGVLGVHPTAEPEVYLKGYPQADFAIRGEPEQTVDALMRQLLKSNELVPMPGLSIRDGKAVASGPDNGFIADVSSLGKPDWSLINTRRYRLPFLMRPFLPVLTSRGCPYRCNFCTQHLYYGHPVRPRSPEDIRDEIQELQAQFSIHDFFLWSECFSANRDHAYAVCQALKEIPEISWVATTRPDCVDAELLRAMREAGCWLVAFGFESGSQAVVDSCRKGLSLADSVRAVRWAHEAGLRVVGHFIFGLPGETHETARSTMQFSLDLDIDFAQFYCAAPYPGTALYDWWHGTSNSQPIHPTRIGQDQACMATEELFQKEIDQWRRRAYRIFYGRPQSIKTLVSLAYSQIFRRKPKLNRARETLSLQGSSAPLVKETSRIVAVVPVLNEVNTVREVVEGCRKHVHEILVIDGGSNDGTQDAAKSSGARVISLDTKGKGAAYQFAIRKGSADVLVFIDGDGSHSPADIPKLVNPILLNQAELVIGSRVLGGSDELYQDPGHLVRIIGTGVLQAFVNWRLNADLSDIQNGFRAIKTTIAQDLNLNEQGFCIDQEMVLKCLRFGYRVLNVPSHEFRRRYGKSKLNLWKSWPKFLWNAGSLVLGSKKKPFLEKRCTAHTSPENLL
ncbi:MAG: radical SAM protein [Bryobacterales bacterium]